MLMDWPTYRVCGSLPVWSPRALMARVRVPALRCQAEAMVKGWAPSSEVAKLAKRN